MSRLITGSFSISCGYITLLALLHILNCHYHYACFVKLYLVLVALITIALLIAFRFVWYKTKDW